MSSRDYSDKLSFQQRTLTTAASGQQVESWTTIFIRYGRVEQTAAGEALHEDQLRVDEAYRLTLPYDQTAAALTALAWRVVWRDRLNVNHTLNLTGVDPGRFGRMNEIVLTASV